MASVPHFQRSISLNDLDSALRVRELVQQDLASPQQDDNRKHCFLQVSSRFSFVLPTFKDYSLDFKKFLYSYLLDMDIYKELQGSQILNWCSAVFPLVPILTIGDGNCLMHAASIGMWAVNDRYHILRKAVYDAFLEDTQGLFHKRWQREHEIFKQQYLGGYEMTEDQWTQEWREIIRLISNDEYPGGPNALQYGSLEEIHIFVLANILRRTIIVLSADTLRGNYDESLSPINFAGIYLPLNWDPVDCVKTPLVIGFAQGHFTAIVNFVDGKLDQGVVTDGLDTEQVHAVPLVKHNGEPLPVHFLLEDEEVLKDGLLRQYLDCAKVTHKDQDGHGRLALVTKLQAIPSPDCVKNLVDGYFARASETYQHMLNQMNMEQGENRDPSLFIMACRTEGCTYSGTSQTMFLCSECWKQHLRDPEGPPSQANPVPSLSGPMTSSGSPGVELPQPVPPRMTVHKQHQQPMNYPQPLPTNSPSHQLPTPLSPREQKPQKCATTGCKYNAASETGNWCSRCYESERNAEELAASINHLNIRAKRCANSVNGCKFYGLPAQHDLCSRCYRRFCIKMETTHGGNTTAVPPLPSRPLVPQRNKCQMPNCVRPGVPELYGRCVECYSDCIRAFINSEESTVNMNYRSATRSTSPSPRPASSPSPGDPTSSPSHPPKKGNICATPGCLNDKDPQLQELCSECFPKRPGMHLHQTATFPMSTGATGLQIVASVAQHTTSLLPEAATQCTATKTVMSPSVSSPFLKEEGQRVVPALLTAFGHSSIYCSSPECISPVGSGTGQRYCPRCFYENHREATAALPSPQQLQPQLAATGVKCQGTLLNLSTSGVVEPREEHFQGAASVGRVQERPPPLIIPHPTVSTSTSGNAANPSAPPVITPGYNSSHHSGIKCATPNCTFYGEAEKNFLCSNCYNKNMAEWQKLSHIVQLPVTPLTAAPVLQYAPPLKQVAATVPNEPVCAINTCSHPAAPGLNDLCENCYHTAVHDEAEWHTQQANRAAAGHTAPVRARQLEQRSRPTYQPPSEVVPRRSAIQSRRVIQPSATKATKPHISTFVNTGAPCKSMGCLRFGTPEKDGLCEDCFEKFQRQQSKVPRSPVPPHTTSLFAYRPQGRFPLRTQAPIVTTAQNRQGSVTATTFSAQGPVQVSQFQNVLPLGAGTGAQIRKCIQQGCNMYGSPETGGFCSKCFYESTMSSYPESIPDTSSSPEAATSNVSQRLPEDVQSGVTSGVGIPGVCSISHCTNLANPYLRSHCTQCFERLYPELASREDYLPIRMAQLHTN